MRILLFTLFLFFIAACGKKKDSVSAGSSGTVVTPPPDWVANRPHSPNFYIGVGSCSKFAQPYDYQTVAKKNALNDLASEISVRVQGQTFLNSLEVNDSFSEEFISNVSTTTDEKIEGYEVAGSWEDKNEYWVFYRLDKAAYQMRKQAKKSAALNMANDFFVKAQTAESESNVAVAYDLYMRALFTLKEYWNEPNEITTERGRVFLDNEIFSSVQRMCNGIQLGSNAEKIVLKSDNGYAQALDFTVRYNNKPVRGISIVCSYDAIGEKVKRTLTSSDAGAATITVSNVDYSAGTGMFKAEVDLHNLIVADLDVQLQEGLMKSFKAEKKILPIEAILPSFFVTSSEANYGVGSSGKVLQGAMNAALVAKGMRVAGSVSEADYTVSITADTKEGGSANGFVTALLDMAIVVRNSRNNQIVYNETLSALKGLQLNKDAASMEAYKKGKERIEQQLIAKLIDTIM